MQKGLAPIPLNKGGLRLQSEGGCFPNTRGGLGVVWIVIILAALVGGGYVFMFEHDNPFGLFSTDEGLVDSTDREPIFEKGSNVLTDWNTYRNEEYGFEVRYPADWFAEGATLTSYNPALFARGGFPSNNQLQVQFYLFPKGQFLSLSDWFVKLAKSGTTFVTSRELRIGGEVAKRTEGEKSCGPESGCGEPLDGNIRLLHNGRGFQISFVPYNSKLIDDFEKILSTFRFTSTPESKTRAYRSPVIDSISPSSGSIGTEIKIYGTNLLDNRGDQNVVIVNSKGELAYLGFGDASGSEVRDSAGNFLRWSYLKVKIGSRICKERATDAGLPCASWMTILPGRYFIFIDHTNVQGHFESNRVEFTVSS